MKRLVSSSLVLALCLGCLFIMIRPQQVSAQQKGSPEAAYQSFTFDKHDQAVPSPHGFLPSELISGASMGTSNLRDPQDLFVDAEGALIADSGNNRILVLDRDLDLVREITTYVDDGAEQTFNYPTGVFRSKQDGTIYVADQQNGKIVLLDEEGKTLNVFGKPESPLIAADLRYQPSKVVADSFGRIFVQAKGVYEGLITLDMEGEFLNYFGSNPVKLTPRMIVTKLWRTILSDEQRASMQAFIPVEYSNISIDDENFIHATVAAISGVSQSMVKINPLGAIINEWTFEDSMLADAQLGRSGMVTALDGRNGILYVVPDQEERGQQTILFNFGGRGDKLGTFRSPTAIAYQGDDLLVLDATKNSLTRFRLTDFGHLVHEAMGLYTDGRYQESLEPWSEVIARNQNYLTAHQGRGKAFYQTEDYVEAMAAFKLANDRQGYSESFQKYSVELMRDNFHWIVLGVVGLVLLSKLIGTARRRSITREVQA